MHIANDTLIRIQGPRVRCSKGIKVALALACLGSLLNVCSSFGYSHHHGKSSVAISPISATVQVGLSQQFTATVSGTTNTAVNWLVNGVAGGNSSVGTISSTGLYTAPSSVPTSPVTVTAQSAANSTSSANATVTIVPVPTPVSLSISPGSASVRVGSSQQFTATLSGTTYSAVNWLVNGVAGGNSSVGTISLTGLYTAPSSVPTSPVTVTAQSTANSASLANATVTILPAPTPVSVVISPGSASLQVARSQQFTATVSGTTNSAVNWLAAGIAGGNSSVGTISAGGMYTAPSSVPTSPVTVTAQSAANPPSSANATVTILPAPTPVSVSISPGSASVQVGSSQQFTAAVTGTTNTAVNWLVGGIAGGNSTVGTISSAGLYTAPSSAPTNTVTVTAQSAFASTSSASATVTITAAVHSVVLSWTASTSAVSGYNIYRGTTSGGPYARLDSSLDSTTTYTDSSVQAGSTYYYVTTAVDSSGVESTNSNEVSATIP